MKTKNYKKQLAKNIRKLKIGNCLDELIFFIPIMVPFFGGLGFSMMQILILEASFSFMMMIFEIPSGYLADLYGRKHTLVIGSLIEFIGLIIFISSSTFEFFLFGEIIFGLGASLVSGSGEALLFDTLLELKRKKSYKKIQGTLFFYGRMSSLFANATGSLLAIIFLRLPFYVTAIPFGAWVLVNTTLIEPKRHKIEHETWKHFKTILKDTFLHNKKLRYFIIYAAIPPAFFLMNFWLYQRYMEFIEFPVYLFGIVIAGMNIASGLCSKYAEEIERFFSPKLSLILIPFIASASWLILANVKSFLVLPIFFITSALWGFLAPLFLDFIQNMITSDRRATVVSIRSFITRMFFFVFSPFMGWIVDLYSIQTAFLASSVLIFIFGGLSLLALKKVKVL